MTAQNVQTTTTTMTTMTSPTPVPLVTFYRRPLPSSCTALSSKEGRKHFESALLHHGLKSFFPLMEQFTTQSEPAFCGISTLVIVLNALAVDPRRIWKGPWRWYSEGMLNCCMDLEDVKQTGITMKTFACLARCQGLQVKQYFAQDRAVQDFRDAVHVACVENEVDSKPPDPFLVVSYDRQSLGQTGTGHFSPIAAYDPVSDRLLILDTARFKYGAHWVDLETLFHAMNPLDPDTNKSRGYFLVSYLGDDQMPRMPISILIRCTNAQSAVRRKYKEFIATLAGDEVSWEQVVDFWTQSGTKPRFVFEMMQPQLAPMDAAEIDQIDAIRNLARALIPAEPAFEGTNDSCIRCRTNLTRTICLSTQEAMFIIYLASLRPERRTALVYSKANASALVREQLLTEAELVQFAIEASDEFGEDDSTIAMCQLAC